MRKTLFALLLLLAVLEVQSQVLISLLLGDKLNSDGIEFGLEGGLNWSHISNMETDRYLPNFNLGFYFDIRMKDQWNLYTGVLVKSGLGTDHLSEEDLQFLEAEIYDDPGDYSQKMNCFLVPVLVKYKFRNHMYCEAGPQFGLIYQSWVEFNSDTEEKDIRIREYNNDMTNWFEAGLMAGAGYTLLKGTGMSLGVKYYYGLTTIYKDRPGATNSSFFLKMNVPIGAGKSRK